MIAHGIAAPARWHAKSEDSVNLENLLPPSPRPFPFVQAFGVSLAPMQPDPCSPMPLPASARPASVIVVDDDPVHCMVLEQVLLQKGAARTATAADGEQALERIASETYDSVILDLSMPRLDGVSFLRRLAAAGYGGTIVIVSGEEEAIRKSAGRLAALLGIACAGDFAKPVEYSAVAECALAPRRPALRRTPAHDGEQAALEAALARNAAQAYFQPIVETASGRLVGAEALIRVPGGDGAMLDAGRIVDLAERTGRIGELTWSMIDAVLREFGAARPSLPAGFRMSFNIAAPMLAEADLADRLSAAVSKAGLSPREFIVELTESRVAEDRAQALETLTLLRLRGFGLAIDDFGAGASNVEQLRLFPFSELKIDRAFLTAAASDRFSAAFVESCMAMASELSLIVVGEGIETEADLALARRHGIHWLQGYLFSRPLPMADLLAWAGARRPAVRLAG
jgi:EAL domain-containing protein (putative c-di-GMP-specific phosphodiesterase class I)/ActR/RegA family two-component response regulator